MSFEALDVAMHDQVSPENMQSLQYKLKSAVLCFVFECVCVCLLASFIKAPPLV